MLFATRYKFVLAAFILSCFFISSCENDLKEVDALMKRQTGVEEGVDVTIYISQEGLMKARLRSPFMLRHQVDSAYVEFPRTLHVDFYNDSLKIESILDAKYARYREYENKVYLRDSVVVINLLKGDTLKTDELWWDQDTQEFYTDKPVEIRQPDKTVYGKGLKAAQDFSWYDIFHITGVVLTSGEGL
jgi:LPS export ABC transporter protein LptC